VVTLEFDPVIVTDGTATFSGIVGDSRSGERLDSYFEPFLAKAVRALFWFLLPLVGSSSRRNFVLSLESSLSLQDGLRSCLVSLSCAKLALEAMEEVEPEVTAAAAAAMEVEVDTAVMDEAAEEDPLEGC